MNSPWRQPAGGSDLWPTAKKEGWPGIWPLATRWWGCVTTPSGRQEARILR